MDYRTLINQILVCVANKCVNALARKRSNSSQDIMFFDCPHVNLCMLLFHDNFGLYYERLRPLHAVLDSVNTI